MPPLVTSQNTGCSSGIRKEIHILYWILRTSILTVFDGGGGGVSNACILKTLKRVARLPKQLVPSNLYPMLHVHVKLPILFWHWEILLSEHLVKHSSTSVAKRRNDFLRRTGKLMNGGQSNIVQLLRKSGLGWKALYSGSDAKDVTWVMLCYVSFILLHHRYRHCCLLAGDHKWCHS